MNVMRKAERDLRVGSIGFLGEAALLSVLIGIDRVYAGEADCELALGGFFYCTFIYYIVCYAGSSYERLYICIFTYVHTSMHIIFAGEVSVHTLRYSRVLMRQPVPHF